MLHFAVLLIYFFCGWLNTALFGKGSHRCPQERRGTFHPQSRMKTSASYFFFGVCLNNAVFFGKGSHRCPQERRGTFHPQSRMKTSASVI